MRAHSAAASQIIFTEPRQNVLTFGVELPRSVPPAHPPTVVYWRLTIFSLIRFVCPAFELVPTSVVFIV